MNEPGMLLSPTEFGSEAEVKCLVCGGRSTGIHYGVVACEGCKAFYKRGLTKSLEFKCYFGGNCIMGPPNDGRGRCKACRFQRCVSAGMNIEGTKRGRTPKAKHNRLKKACRDRVASPYTSAVLQNKVEKSFRKIAPAPSRLTSNPAKALEEEPSAKRISHNNATLQKVPSPPSRQSSVIQRVPTGHFARDVIRYAKPSPPALSTSSSSGVKEIENHETPYDRFRVYCDSFMNAAYQYDRDSRDLARLMPDTLCNLRGFHLDSSLLDILTPCVPGDLVPSLTDGDVVSNMPRFLGQYWRVLKEKHLYVEQTIQTVAEAVSEVYGPDYEMFDEFFRDAVVYGLVPHQPQCTLAAMIIILREAQVEMLQQQCRFLSAIRGFSELSREDQGTVIREKSLETWLVVHHRYVRYNEMYYTMGEDRIHFSAYWGLQFFCVDYLSLVLQLSHEFRCLRLTQTEAFLFLAVSVFNPDTTTAKDKTTLSFLHAHYLDCLLQSIRSRLSATERTNTVDKLLKFLAKSRIMYRVTNLYVRSMDWSGAPVYCVRGGVICNIADIIDLEDDGLQ